MIEASFEKPKIKEPEVRFFVERTEPCGSGWMDFATVATQAMPEASSRSRIAKGANQGRKATGAQQRT